MSNHTIYTFRNLFAYIRQQLNGLSGNALLSSMNYPKNVKLRIKCVTLLYSYRAKPRLCRALQFSLNLNGEKMLQLILYYLFICFLFVNCYFSTASFAFAAD